jgi:hypothetical protein
MTTTSKTPVDFHVFTANQDTPFVVLAHRVGRFPIQKAMVTPAGVIELSGQDGVVETLGSSAVPCTANVIKRIRTHHEGLLLVQVDPDRTAESVSEQVVSARFF